MSSSLQQITERSSYHPSSPVQSSPNGLLSSNSSHSIPSFVPMSNRRSSTMKGTIVAKGCLKSSRATRTSMSSQHRSVSFREKDSDEVYTADDWDRSPVDLTPKLTYDDILELKEMQISTARANAVAVSQNAHRLGVPAPPPRVCARVPVGLLPLLPESPSSTPNASQSGNYASSPTSFSFAGASFEMIDGKKPISPPSTPPRRLFHSIPPPDPPVKRAFVFVPLLDNSSSPQVTPTSSACPSPRLQASPSPASPTNRNIPPMSKPMSPSTGSNRMAFPPSPPAEPHNTSNDSYFSAHNSVSSTTSPASASGPRNGFAQNSPGATSSSPSVPMRKFRLPTMPLLPTQSTTPSSPSSRFSSSQATPPNPGSCPTSPVSSSTSSSPRSTSSVHREPSPRPRTPNFVGVGTSTMIMS